MLRIAVIGPAGSGNSFLINQVLGYEAVKHGVSASPVTLDISDGHQFTDGEQRMEILLVFADKVSQERRLKEI